MTLVVNTPAATASASATIRAKSAFGPEALRPPAMPTVCPSRGCTHKLLNVAVFHMFVTTAKAKLCVDAMPHALVLRVTRADLVP